MVDSLRLYIYIYIYLANKLHRCTLLCQRLITLVVCLAILCQRNYKCYILSFIWGKYVLWNFRRPDLMLFFLDRNHQYNEKTKQIYTNTTFHTQCRIPSAWKPHLPLYLKYENHTNSYIWNTKTILIHIFEIRKPY